MSGMSAKIGFLFCVSSDMVTIFILNFNSISKYTSEYAVKLFHESLAGIYHISSFFFSFTDNNLKNSLLNILIVNIVELGPCFSYYSKTSKSQYCLWLGGEFYDVQIPIYDHIYPAINQKSKLTKIFFFLP